MKSNDEVLELGATKKTEIRRLIAEGWRAVASAERAVHRGGSKEEPSDWLYSVEDDLLKVQEKLLSLDRGGPEACARHRDSEEWQEIEDLLLQIKINSWPDV